MSATLSMLGLAAALSAAPAAAQDGDTTAAEGDAPAQEGEAPAEKPKADSALTLEGPYSKKPYAKPVVGAMVWEGAVGLNVGAEAGLKYQQKKKDPVFFGKTRAVGTLAFGDGISGYQVNVGSFFGPFYKVVGAQMGPDLFYSQYTFLDTELPATMGLDWPVTGLFNVKVFDAYAGIAPGWYFGGERENLNAVLGQYSLYAGAGINLSKLRLHLGWNKQVTFYGEQTGISIGFGI